MKFRLRRTYVLCGSCLLAILLAVLGEWRRWRSREYSTPDTLVLATTVEPATLHPVFGVDRMSAVEVLVALFEPLTVYDDRRQLLPCLAAEVPTPANGGIRLLTDEEAQARGGR